MTAPTHLTAAERDTILAALKYHKASSRCAPASEIDRLCERLSAPVAPHHMGAMRAADAVTSELAKGPTSLAAVATIIAREMPPQAPEPVNAELLAALKFYAAGNHFHRCEDPWIADATHRYAPAGAIVEKGKIAADAIARVESALAAQKGGK